jgi:hypothetical protein
MGFDDEERDENVPIATNGGEQLTFRARADSNSKKKMNTTLNRVPFTHKQRS